MQNGYLVQNGDGSVWQWDRWQAGMGLVDFTNPDACRWYADKLRSLVDMGVDCFKTDFGERIPAEGVKYYDGSDPVRMHNYYTFLYNQVVFGVLEEKLGKGNATVFARSATTGGQQFPVHWGGDCTATFESMAESLRGGLSLTMSGFGFWSHDIGGFEQTASADVYKRWCAFGLLSSHSRLHGNDSYRVPWLFDEGEQEKQSAVEVLRFFTQLKCRLMPYLYQTAVEAHTRGVPVMRAMHLEFPDDPGCDTLDRQYMLGGNLLVAPVLRSDGQVDYYLPAGQWTNILTGKVVSGGRWVREQHHYLSLPLLARPNALIAEGALNARPDYEYADGVVLHLFEPDDGAVLKATIPATSGEPALEVTVTRSGKRITARAEGSVKAWSIQLWNVNAAADIEGAAASSVPYGMRLTANQGSDRIAFTI
jgi:alpha-D-xyloside xylohydrolase